MVVRELKVKDFKGNEREYKLHFNMTEAEIMEFEFGSEKGGISEAYERMLRAQDTPEIMRALRSVVMTAYGVLSADGESFQKSEDISRAFSYSAAYSDFIMKLYTDDAYGKAFLTELFPPEVIKKILARVEEQNKKKEAAEQKEAQVTQFPAGENTEAAPHGPIVPGANN